MSTVFRVVKNENYTTLSNFHFKDRRLSWKAKGLLSTMLSLPDNWNYTIEGLASLSDDGIKATNSGLKELERCGYLIRHQCRDDGGHYGVTEYIIYEQPQEDVASSFSIDEQDAVTEFFNQNDRFSQPYVQNGQTVENRAFAPYVQNRQTENRQTEKGVQLNTNILNTKELNTYNISSSSPEESKGHEMMNEDTEEEEKRRLEFDKTAQSCSGKLAEAVYVEYAKRSKDFRNLITAAMFRQICMSIMEKQHREPIRMLPNLINTYFDNLIIGARTIGCSSLGRDSPTATRGNPFLNFPQNSYDFSELEKELNCAQGGESK